jgi:tetratricopeptide (TPR) repeat protein
LDYILIENFDAAIGDLNYYTNVNQSDHEAFYLLGLAYASLEKYDSAIKAYSSAIAINPNYIETYNLRGVVYLTTGKYNAAIQDFNKVLEIDPSNYDAINYLAVAKQAKDTEDQALVDELLSTLLLGGDPYSTLYNFGYELGLQALLGE